MQVSHLIAHSSLIDPMLRAHVLAGNVSLAASSLVQSVALSQCISGRAHRAFCGRTRCHFDPAVHQCTFHLGTRRRRPRAMQRAMMRIRSHRHRQMQT